MTVLLAGSIAVLPGSGLRGRPGSRWHSSGLRSVPSLFVFIPKLMQEAMKADADAVIDTFGKNEHVKKVFWTLFIAMAGLVMAHIVDTGTAQQIVGMITGKGG